MADGAGIGFFGFVIFGFFTVCFLGFFAFFGFVIFSTFAAIVSFQRISVDPLYDAVMMIR